MGVTSPRYKSPTRLARSTRLSTRSIPVPATAEASYYERLPSVHSRRVTLFAIACMVVFCPPLVIYLWYAHMHLDGSITKLRSYIRQDHGLLHIGDIWPRPSLNTFKILGGFAIFQAILLVWLPAPYFFGPVTPAGNRPLYKRNGFAAYWLTMFATYMSWREGIFNPAILYDLLGEIISASICISVVLSIFLYLKGHVCPSSSDYGTSGSAILDVFWGMELHPRIGKWFDIKVFLSSRIGMMSWALLVVSYICKQIQSNSQLYDSMFVTSSLMLIYITKHFWLEQGFFNSLDMAHDRAGLYTLWCSLVWIPAVYTSPALFLAAHPIHLGYKVAVPIFLLGLISIFLLYDSDRQKTEFRHTSGKCLIWGKPGTKINAHYATESGEHHTSLLLTSGWWGLARHFHYLPESCVAFLWTLPCLLTHFLPYFYFLSLVCLLVDRAKRDDNRCRRKYQKYWETYCRRVPWRIVPHVY